MERGTWEALVDANYQAIYRFTFHLLRSRRDAEDATHDTFEKAYRALPTLNDTSRARSWLYSIARNVSIDRQRRATRFPELEFKGELAAPVCSPDLTMDLEALIAQLPERQREVFVLRHWHGFDTAETAHILGIDDGTVKAHLKRAVDKLRTALNAVKQSEASTTLPSQSSET